MGCAVLWHKDLAHVPAGYDAKISGIDGGTAGSNPAYGVYVENLEFLFITFHQEVVACPAIHAGFLCLLTQTHLFANQTAS